MTTTQAATLQRVSAFCRENRITTAELKRIAEQIEYNELTALFHLHYNQISVPVSQQEFRGDFT